MDYFRALYPVDGQIPDKKGISDIVKEMGKGLGKITEIDYTFTLEINDHSGATLTISNDWYNDVQYTGTISQVY